MKSRVLKRATPAWLAKGAEAPCDCQSWAVSSGYWLATLSASLLDIVTSLPRTARTDEGAAESATPSES